MNQVSWCEHAERQMSQQLVFWVPPGLISSKQHLAPAPEGRDCSCSSFQRSWLLQHLYRITLCIGHSSRCSDQITNTCNPGMKVLIVSILEGKSQQQEPRQLLTWCLQPGSRGTEATTWLSLSFIQCRTPAQGRVPPHRENLSTSVNLLS